ncbi:MAG: sulfatase family protein [Planctomycetota bacterium]|jgi:arylsulfatase A-like enzyme
MRRKKIQGDLSRREVLKYGLYGGLSTALSSSLWVSGCSKSKGKNRPNVLFISIDTLRRDHCSLYGYKLNTTPNLRAFAGQSAIFDLAYSPTATTAPSHATMFTSLYPITHRLIKNGLKLSPKYKTLAEILKMHQYQTAAVVSSFVLDTKFGFAKGFDHYDDGDFEKPKSTAKPQVWEGHVVTGGFDRRADHTSQKVVKWLRTRRNPNKSFFLFVHYFDPHSPYHPPEPFYSRFAPKKKSANFIEKSIARYDAEIAFTDYEIGRILQTLKAIGVEQNTIVVITSDHGEGLMEHGHMEHGIHIYEEAVRVPLLFRWPNHIPKAKLFNAPVELLSIAPTILDLVGISLQDPPFQGYNLTPALRNNVPLDKNRPVYLHRRHYEGRRYHNIWVTGEKFGIRVDDWKYIEGKEENTKELFNLKKDPAEMKNLFSGFQEKTDELSGKLKKWIISHIGDESDVTIDEKDLEILKSLGYVK